MFKLRKILEIVLASNIPIITHLRIIYVKWITDSQRKANFVIKGHITLRGNPKNLRIGNNVYIGKNCIFDCLSKINIKNNVKINSEVKLLNAHSNNESKLSIYDNTFIDDNVLIDLSTNVMI